MDDRTFRQVIASAELAPSVHNTQPWSFAVVGDTIEVRADRQRQLSVLDPHGRALAISCGAAVEFAALAVRAFGWDCQVHLLPDTGGPDLLATLEIGAAGAPDAEAAALVDAMSRRFTDRGPYDADPVPADVISGLEPGVAQRGAWLSVLEREGDRLAVIQALTDAEAAEAADPDFRDEISVWVRTEAGPDGIPVAALDDPGTTDVVTDVPRRDFSGRNRHLQPGGFEVPPRVERDTLLMLGTDGDSVVDWLRAGRALGWLLLRLTDAGFSTQPLGQALDVEATRARLQHQLGMVSHIQILLRVGRGHGRPTTGRRHRTVQA